MKLTLSIICLIKIISCDAQPIGFHDIMTIKEEAYPAKIEELLYNRGFEVDVDENTYRDSSFTILTFIDTVENSQIKLGSDTAYLNNYSTIDELFITFRNPTNVFCKSLMDTIRMNCQLLYRRPLSVVSVDVSTHALIDFNYYLCDDVLFGFDPRLISSDRFILIVDLNYSGRENRNFD